MVLSYAAGTDMTQMILLTVISGPTGLKLVLTVPLSSSSGLFSGLNVLYPSESRRLSVHNKINTSTMHITIARTTMPLINGGS